MEQVVIQEIENCYAVNLSTYISRKSFTNLLIQTWFKRYLDY